MNRASCLSLLSNAVLVDNTVRIGQVRARAKAQGQAFTPEAIAHVSPLARRHVIGNGTYDFSPSQSVMPRRNYACHTLAFKSAWILCEGLWGTAWMAADARGSHLREICGKIGLGRRVRACPNRRTSIAGGEGMVRQSRSGGQTPTQRDSPCAWSSGASDGAGTPCDSSMVEVKESRSTRHRGHGR